jgi:hypothetical protein
LSITTNGLVGESVRVVTTAGFVGRSTAVLLGSARSSDVKAVGVSVVVVDRTTVQKDVQKVGDKSTFNGTGSGGTVVAGVDGRAFFGDGKTGTADSRDVGDFPGNTGGTFVFSISHGAFVTVGHSFAHLVDSVDGCTFTSSVVFVEVAPAAVFVQTVDGGSELSSESSSKTGVFFEDLSELVVQVGSDHGKESEESGVFHDEDDVIGF